MQNEKGHTTPYYNGMERIASRLGDQGIGMAQQMDGDLLSRKNDLGKVFIEQFQEMLGNQDSIKLLDTLQLSNLNPSADGLYYYHTNHLGSTSFVTDENASVVQGFLYAPFGEITNEYNSSFGNNVLPKYSFNAKELDEETGMYYYEARYMAPPVFISRDPLFEKYPTFSPYAYCANNPVKYVDPDGRDWYQNAEGKPIYDKNVNENTQLGKGEFYIGRTANWFGFTEQDRDFLYHGDEKGNVTRKDLSVKILGKRNTEGINNVEGQNASSIETNKTPWMDIAKTQIGVAEATGHNDGVQVEKYLKSVGLGKGYPWCAAFVNWSLNQVGIEGAGARGNNYLNWGISLNEPKYGAVAIFNTGHVGFYAGKNGENYKILHGNWSDKVSFSTNIKPSEIKSFRFPK